MCVITFYVNFHHKIYLFAYPHFLSAVFQITKRRTKKDTTLMVPFFIRYAYTHDLRVAPHLPKKM